MTIIPRKIVKFPSKLIVVTSLLLTPLVYGATTINVSQYGATSNDSTDDTLAIQEALNAAKSTSGAVVVQFSSGQYRLGGTTSGSKFCLSLNGGSDLKIDGNGAELLVTDPLKGVLELRNCSKFTVQNFDIDYDPVPYSEGYVQSVNVRGGNVTIRLRPGFPAPTQSFFSDAAKVYCYMIDDNTVGSVKEGTNSFYLVNSTQFVNGNRYRLNIDFRHSGIMGDFSNGSRVVLVAKNAGVFYSLMGDDVNFYDINAYAGSSTFVIGDANSTVRVVRCRTVIKNGRWKSLNGGGVVLSGVKNLRVEDCDFQGLSDDGIAPSMTCYAVGTVNSPSSIVLKRNGQVYKGGAISVNDILQFVRPSDAMVLARARVSSKNTTTGTYTIDRNVSGLAAGTWIGNVSFAKNIKILNNTIRDSRRYGILLRGEDVTIDGNTFSNISTGAIAGSSLDLPGASCRNVTISNNAISNCGYDRAALSVGSVKSAPITFYVEKSNGALGTHAGNHRNITIEPNNTMENTKMLPFIALSNTTAASIDDADLYLDGGSTARTSAGVVLRETAAVTVGSVNSDVSPFHIDEY